MRDTKTSFTQGISVLMFDGSKTKEGASVGVKVINPKGNVYRFVN